MRMPFEVSLTFAWECQACGAKTSQEMAFRYGTSFNDNYPWMPSGWTVFDGRPLCPGHFVTIEPLSQAKNGGDA